MHKSKYTTKGMENNMQPKMSDFLEFNKEKTKLDNELAQVAAEAGSNKSLFTLLYWIFCFICSVIPIRVVVLAQKCMYIYSFDRIIRSYSEFDKEPIVSLGPLPSLPPLATVASATTQPPSTRTAADDDHAASVKPTTSSSTVESDSTTTAAAGKVKTKKGGNKELLKSRTKASGENKENSKKEQPIQPGPDANTIVGQQAPSADDSEKLQSEISFPAPVAVSAASRDSFSSSAAVPAQKIIKKELTVMDLMRQQIEEAKNPKPAVAVHPSGGSDNTGKLQGEEPEEEGKASSGPPAKKRRNKRKTGTSTSVAGANGADVVQEGDQRAGQDERDGEGSGETSAGGVHQKPNDGAPPNMYQPKMTEFLDINSMMK